MTLKTVVVLAVVILAGAVGDTLVSKGMRAVGEITSLGPASLAGVALRALRQPFVLLGTLCLATYFLTFLAVLSWADVSLVVPITSLGFLLTTFLAQWALHERVTPLRWAGTLLIIMGVALVARSATTDRSDDDRVARTAASPAVTGMVGSSGEQAGERSGAR